MIKLFIYVGCFYALTFQVFASPIVKNVGIYGDKFQGDIKLTEQQENFIRRIKTKGEGVRPNTGWTHPFFRWPMNLQGFVIVPYRINPSEGFTQAEINLMLSEFRILESRTCVRFVQRTFEIDFVEIINGEGCWSWLGRIGGRQELSMDRNGCVVAGITLHEAIHALGYDHMHNHINRDNFVQINWNNIEPEFQFAFDIVDPEWFDNFNTPYDILSSMHYPRWAFSINGQDTIVPHDRRYIDIMGLNQLSEGDVIRLNRMYQCRT